MYTSIPSLHVSSPAKAKGVGTVFILSRSGSPSPSGKFEIRLDVSFDPAANDYPVLNSLTIKADLTDGLNGTYTATSIELINSYGKHNPTIYITGRCKFDGNTTTNVKGFKYWVIIANNKQANTPATSQGTPDVVGFTIIDNKGDRIAYATGPLQSGDIEVAPN